MNDKKLSRRDFLIAAGCSCAGLVLAGSGCSRPRGTTATAALACPYGYRYDPWPGQCYRYVDNDGSGYCDLSEAGTTSAATVVPATGPAASPAVTATPAAPNSDANGSGSNPSTELVVLCDRLCSYPGRCGRYTDTNGTGRCDLVGGHPLRSGSELRRVGWALAGGPWADDAAARFITGNQVRLDAARQAGAVARSGEFVATPGNLVKIAGIGGFVIGLSILLDRRKRRPPAAQSPR